MAKAQRKTNADHPSATADGAETRSFAAETARVLHLMIHALYTNRDIFLRELISNASDACDKLRYAALTNDVLYAGDAALGIQITCDEKARTITIADSGIGMNRDDLISNLGTIAKSGTQEFLSKLSGDAKRDSSLIGQFGVGFYSSFMVADRVQVVTRKAGEAEAWMWESDGQGSYAISPTEVQARGTSITLYLKEDAAEYLDPFRLRHIVTTYSDHIGFPVSLTDAEGKSETVNAAQAIWTKAKADVTDAQYQEFYRHVAHSPEAPWAVLHNKAEGVVEYANLLYIPGIKPFDLFHPERRRRVKLYVKRVFITDEGVDLVPPYLRFLRGVVDSADLPLNISRETLQKSPTLDKIRESVTSRVLTELKKRSEKDPADYAKFWENFGAVLKEGLCEGSAPREKILDACRFHSTHGEGLVSLAEYQSRMREGQEAIYCLTGDSLSVLKHSPQLEGFTKRGIEVLLLTDHVDDFWLNVTLKYGDLPFKSVLKAGDDLDKFPLEGEDAKKEEEAEKSEAILALCAAMKTLYGELVKEVRTTRKLGDTPVCLSVGEGDMDMRMERFLMEHQQLPKRAAKIIEINPLHPVVQALSKKAAEQDVSSVVRPGISSNLPDSVAGDPGIRRDDAFSDALWLLYDQALIAEGEPVSDPAAFARRLGAFMHKGLL